MVNYLLDTSPWINAVTLPESIPNWIIRLLGSAEPKGIKKPQAFGPAVL
jgi:hypothetical protein